MFTSEQYRAKASEYAKLAEIANGPNVVREFQRLERSLVGQLGVGPTDGAGAPGSTGSILPRRSKSARRIPTVAASRFQFRPAPGGAPSLYAALRASRSGRSMAITVPGSRSISIK
jgi:hypothetical protein